MLFAALFLAPIRARVQLVQWMDGTENCFGERSLYHNLGYWADGPGTLDAACDALAELMARRADIGEGSRVLDVGCGFGDQDSYWVEHFRPAKLVGTDLMDFKVDLARRRAAERLGREAPEFTTCSATALPFSDNDFDAVLSLEASFHFITRADFFAEARRVLRPGGVLVLAEPAPIDGTQPNRVAEYLQRTVVAVPKENLYGASRYQELLGHKGFADIRVESLRDEVYPHYMRYLGRRLADADIVERVNPLVRAMWRGWVEQFDRAGEVAGQDYLLVSAVAR